METANWNPPQHWPALCMAARLAVTHQRAYRSPQSNIVRFYPSRLTIWGDGFWIAHLTAWGELERIQVGDTRLSDAEASRLWATRPK